MSLRDHVDRTVASLGEFIAQADDKPYNPRSDAWAGAQSYDEARQMCVDGWSGARDTVHDIVRRVLGDITPHLEMADAPVASVVGGAVNVPLFLAGVPNSMMRFVQDERLVAKPVVKMLVDAGAEGAVSSDQMLRRASALAAFVEAVHKLGNTVSIESRMVTINTTCCYSCIMLVRISIWMRYRSVSVILRSTVTCGSLTVIVTVWVRAWVSPSGLVNA
jgi:hypothetical protein